LEKLTIVGAGLIGGSLGLSAQKRGLAKQVAALVRRAQSVAECQSLGIAHNVTIEAAEAIADADLIVICTPVASMVDLVKSWLPIIKSGAVVTDVGSTKKQLVNELTPIIAETGAHFVGSHPMAGSAKTGPSAARADLFEGAVCVVTPGKDTDSNAIQLVSQFWEGLGSLFRLLISLRCVQPEFLNRASRVRALQTGPSHLLDEFAVQQLASSSSCIEMLSHRGATILHRR